MRISLYANDLGPFQDLQLLADATRAASHNTILIGNEPLGGRNIFAHAPDVLVTGLSSVKNEEELALGERAEELGIPWVILADTPRSWRRRAAHGRIGYAILLVGSPTEVEEAKAFGYQRIEYLGGPPKRQKKWDLLPVALPPGVPSVFVGGIKDPVITNNFLAAVVHGCRAAFGPTWLYFRAHPNEDGSKSDARPELRDVYLREAELREDILTGVNVAPESYAKMPSSDVLAISADHAFFTAGDTDSETAAMHHRRAYYYESPAVRARVLDQTGFETWAPADAGALVRVTSAGEVATAIRRLDSEAKFFELNVRQAAAYPMLSADAPPVENRILRFLSDLTGKQ